MNSREIRERFFNYFEGKQHKIVSSAPMVIKDDPTLMFTNAGMNQFKDYFLGNRVAGEKRLANTQKCLRVSGKHNDLEEVGVDTYHHTMFEMLGNWSFGDYFKKEAIEWAWELLTKEYGIDESNLYITVFGGDAADGLEKDQEAIELWKEWVREDKILECSKKDNFWEMGDTGPCGPCSEIHVDLRSAEEKALKPGRDLVNADHPQVIEIWNLVFMEFNRKSDGSLEALPARHVDTGMGFERLSMVLQGKQSNYDTDVFMPLIEKVEDLSGLRYKPHEETREQVRLVNVAMRVIVDHVRAISMSIADGQLPGNTGAGYVIRRILRRAVRYGYQSLNLKEPFIYRLVPVLARNFQGTFDELNNQKELIEKVIKEEEASFFRTLENGLKKIDDICIRLNAKGEKTVDGKDVFELYDTYGFPDDLTALIAQGYELTIDEVGFKAELEKQRSRSRDAAAMEVGDWVELMEDDVEEFVGYDYTNTEVAITRYRQVKQKGRSFYQLVFNITPFYPEGGGQIGDTGYIDTGSERVEILDTKRENNLIIHFAETLPVDTRAKFQAVVDMAKREATAANHSATHLMHQALREVLGTHVEQKGSLVSPNYLRFDFSHFQKVTPEEQVQIEDLVNQRIAADFQLEEHRNMPIGEAKKQGAMMLFGEKYGDVVRMIRFGESAELCGGIHVSNTGKIGRFIIITETAVAAGIRRIEAVTAYAAQDLLETKLRVFCKSAGLIAGITEAQSAKESISRLISSIAEDLRTMGINPNVTEPEYPDQDPLVALKIAAQYMEDVKEHEVRNSLQKIRSKLMKAADQSNQGRSIEVKGELKDKIKVVKGVNFLSAQVDLDGKSMKDVAFQLKNEIDNLYLVLVAEQDGKVVLTVAVSDNLVTEKELHAGKIIGELAREVGGGGGGQPTIASAGGKNPAGITSALQKAESYLN